jgi:hypothetical protein
MLKHYEYVLPGQMSLEAAASVPPASLPPVAHDGGPGSAPAPRPSPKSPAATLRTGSQAGPSRSDDGGA